MERRLRREGCGMALSVAQPTAPKQRGCAIDRSIPCVHGATEHATDTVLREAAPSLLQLSALFRDA
jgi:hypothetical protein